MIITNTEKSNFYSCEVTTLESSQPFITNLPPIISRVSEGVDDPIELVTVHEKELPTISATGWLMVSTLSKVEAPLSVTVCVKLWVTPSISTDCPSFKGPTVVPSLVKVIVVAIEVVEVQVRVEDEDPGVNTRGLVMVG